MLTQVDVEGDNVLALPVSGAKPRDSLHLEGFTGLGPPDKSLFIGDYARDGGIYSGRKVLTRNPVLTVGVNPNYGKGETMDGLRSILYKAFNDPLPTVDSVTLILHDDELADRYLTGYCDKFTNEIMGDDTSCQISMVCPDPYIRDVQQTDLIGSWQQVPFTYAGTAETGFEATITVSASTSTITLNNNSQTMILTYPFLANDVVYVNTIPGSRKIQLTRSGTTYDILYTLYSGSPWMFLHSTSNTMTVYGATPTDIIAAITEFKYRQTWWGL